MPWTQVETGTTRYYSVMVIFQETQEPRYWHRLGICQWTTLKEFEDNNVVRLVQGVGPEWQEISDLYT
jgi:hypothetical protein